MKEKHEIKWITAMWLGAKPEKNSFHDMHGFEGPAANNVYDAGETIMKGRITGAYTLRIPSDGICNIADTPYNRKKLAAHTSAIIRDVVVESIAGGKKHLKTIKKSFGPWFKILSEGASLPMTQDEERTMLLSRIEKMEAALAEKGGKKEKAEKPVKAKGTGKRGRPRKVTETEQVPEIPTKVEVTV